MTLSVDHILQRGIEAHKGGRIQEAERLYKSILQQQANHPDANHNLGVLAVGVGKPELALPLFKVALEANPKQVQYWLSMIDVLIKVGQIANARKILQQGRDTGLKGEQVDQIAKQLESEEVLSASPNPAGAPQQEQVNALTTLYNQGRLEEVVKQTNILVEQFPQAIILFNILGAANAGLRRLDAAIESYRRALQIKPDLAEAHYNLGYVLHDNGDLTAAIESYKHALQIKPDYVDAHYNLGYALHDNGDLTAAIESYKRAPDQAGPCRGTQQSW